MNWRVSIGALVAVTICGTAGSAYAAVAAAVVTNVKTDGSLGAAVDLSGTKSVDPAMGKLKDSNLFHSFSVFDIGNKDTFTFLGAPKVTNIIARVTGGTSSAIQGTIVSPVNLYLMNPAGIIFSGNATLQINGSFFATGADQIDFGPKDRFAVGTKLREDKSFTLAPSGFGFGGKTRGSVSVDGATLTGGTATTLGLIGAGVSVSHGSSLNVPRGQVQVTSVSKGTVISTTVEGRTKTHLANHARGAEIRVQDSSLGDFDALATGTGPHQVALRGGSLTLVHSRAYIADEQRGDGIFIHLQGDLLLRATSLFSQVNGNLQNLPVLAVSARSATLDSGFSVFAKTLATGRGGDLRMTLSGRLVLRDGNVSNPNEGSPVSGNLSVRAASADISHGAINAINPAGSKAGQFLVDVHDRLSVHDEGELTFSSGTGKMEVLAGDLSVSGASAAVQFNKSEPGRPAGLLSIQVRDQLSVRQGGVILAFNLGQEGRAIHIEARDILLSGQGAARRVTTGIVGSSTGPAGSAGGEVKLELSGALRVLDGATVSSNTLGRGSGGQIKIKAEEVLVSGLPGMPGTFKTPRGISAQNQSGIGGPSGSIDLKVGSLEVTAGGEVNASTQGTGRGGDITVRGDQVTVSNGGRVTAETTELGSRGRGGDIDLELSGRAAVRDGGSITVSTQGGAPGGSLVVNAGSVLVSGAGAEIAARSGTATEPAEGKGGSVHVEASSLEVLDSGQVTANTFGLAPGGDVHVKADRVLIAQAGSVPTGITATTVARGASGIGGTVEIKAERLGLDGAGATVSTATRGSGSAGGVSLRVGELVMDHGSTIQSSSAAAGLSGSVVIERSRRIQLRGGSSLSVAAAHSSAGDLRVRADAIDLRQSSVTAQAKLTGGNIDLQARDLLFLRDSRVTAAAQANGGNIQVDPRLVVLDHSLLDARAVLASGGNILIQSDSFISDPGSLITATSQRGIDGLVEIDALNIDLTGSLVDLPARPLEAEALLRELCTMKLEDFSSFVRQGRGGLPPSPGGLLPSLEILP